MTQMADKNRVAFFGYDCEAVDFFTSNEWEIGGKKKQPVAVYQLISRSFAIISTT